MQFKDLKIEFEKLVLNFDTFKADIETIIQDIQKEQKDFENKILSLIGNSAIPGEIKAFGEVDKDDLIKIGWKQLEIENGFTLLNSFDNGQKIGINTSGHIAKHNHKNILNLKYFDIRSHIGDRKLKNLVIADNQFDVYPINGLDIEDEKIDTFVAPISFRSDKFYLGEYNEDVLKEKIYNYLKITDNSENQGLNENNYSAGLYVNYFIFDPKDVYDPKTGLLKK